MQGKQLEASNANVPLIAAAKGLLCSSLPIEAVGKETDNFCLLISVTVVIKKIECGNVFQAVFKQDESDLFAEHMWCHYLSYLLNSTEK